MPDSTTIVTADSDVITVITSNSDVVVIVPSDDVSVTVTAEVAAVPSTEVDEQ